MFSRFDTVPACDARTDVQPISITCFSIADARNNKKDGYCQQNVRQWQKLISIMDYDAVSYTHLTLPTIYSV